MIAEFEVRNFFSIRSAQKISFEPSPDKFMADEYTIEVKPGVRLLKIGILYGANASGKTNVLNAIAFFRELAVNAPADRNEATGTVPFLLDEASRNEPTSMSMTFYAGQSKYILSFELDSKRIYSETLTVYDSARPTRLYSRHYDEDSDSTIIDFGINLKLSKKSRDAISGNAINNCSVLAAFGKSNVERSKMNEVYDFFDGRVGKMLAPGMSLSAYVRRHLNDDGGELKSFVLNFLKASDFNIEDVSLNREEEIITPELERLIQGAPIEEEAKIELLKSGKITNEELIFMHNAGNGHYSLPEKYESNGTVRFLGLAVILNFLLTKRRFVSIDEVETSIHYELLAYFIKVFLANSDKPSQLLLTTHDINLLNEDFIRRDAIWFADKDEAGETRIVRLSSLGLHKNLSPYNAYRQGKLVKLPFLGSLYLNLNSNEDAPNS